MDALSQILKTIRLQTGLLSRSHFTLPWAVTTRGAPSPIFHALVSGHCLATRGEDEPIALETADVVVLPHGDPHKMSSDVTTTAVNVGELLSAKDAGGVPMLSHGGTRGDGAVIICGTFNLEHEAANALIDLMPAVIVLKPRDEARKQWVKSTLDMLDLELAQSRPGAESMISRLTDMLVAQVIREYALTTEVSAKGLLAAAHDEHVGRALVLIHTEPGGSWSAERLASTVGMSRTRFFERFSSLVGESPAKYLARWRASAAADMLRKKDLGTAELASQLGYSSENAFVRVFRRYQGVSPAEFRRRIRMPH